MGYMNGATVAQGKPSHKGGWASGSKKEPLADDQGILAAAMHALKDFAPTFVPSGKVPSKEGQSNEALTLKTLKAVSKRRGRTS